MAIVVYPVDAVTGSPTYTGRMARETMSVFLAGATAADPLGARSGVRPGTSATTVTATSTTWSMGLHAGVLDMETAVEAGPYAYAVNTAQTGAVTAADATRPRVDIVWVRLDDPAESDGSSAPAVVAGYTAGAPLASPVAPATPARCMVLATIQVPMSGGGSPTVIWVAPYTVAAGAPIPVRSDADLGLLTWYEGLQVYRLDTHLVETFDGIVWRPTVPAGGTFSGSTDVNGAMTVAHGLGYTPTKVTGIIVGSGSTPGTPDSVASLAGIILHATDGTYLTFRIVRQDTHVWFATQPLVVNWTAM